MPNDSPRPDVAVFIDFENVYVSVRDKLDANPNFESIMERCEDFGRVVIARAYADWYRYPRVTSALYANNIEPMYVPTYYYDRDMGRTGRPIKNSVDMTLCVEAMKTLYTNPNIAKFVLATGDRDFIPLVNTIRQQGKEVIVIGIGGAASAHLAQSADEFIFYETLVGKQSPRSTIDDLPRAKMPEKGREGYEVGDDAPQPRRERTERPERPERPERFDRPERPEPAAMDSTNGATNGSATTITNGATNGAALPAAPPAAPVEPDVYETLVRAINLARERGYVCSFGSLKLLMKELMGGEFKESRYKDSQGRPFAKFKDFVMDAERRGVVQVFTNGTVNEVFLPGEDPYKLSQFAAELKVEPEAAPITLTEQPAENRSDTRSSAPGRRRRRRRSGRQTDRENGEAVLDGIEEYEEEFESAPQLNLILPDLMDADEAAEVFEELLDRIEHEDAQASATLVDSDPAEILDPDTSEIGEAGDTISSSEPYAFADETSTDTVSLEQAQELDAPESENVADESGLARTRPFGEADWQFLREVVGEYAKPASFAQIHDLLRGARNRMSVTRTNEELRTLTKQAINSGMLARQGKGNRVSYKLAEDMVAAESQPEQVQLVDQMTLIEQAGEADFDQLAEQAPGDPESQPEQVQPLDQMTLIEQASEAELTRDAQEADIDQLLAEQAPGDMLAEGLRDAAELASDPVEARAEVAEMQAEVTGIALEPDNELVGTASIEPEAMVAEPTAPQQRSRRRKQSAVEQTAAPEGVAETASSEEQAQPARSRRRKQAAPVEQAPTAEAEKPKRTRRKTAASEE